MPPLTPRQKGHLSATVLSNKYIPLRPTPKQARFLLTEEKEVFYGGAAGGGKSVALLMAALQWVADPNYAALLLRRTYPDLSQPGALMDLGEKWLRPTDAKWDGETKTWRFPSGSTLTFGFLETEKDKYRYQSAEFQFIGWDELTQFTQTQYEYLFSRLRRTEDNPVPLRVRSASNPGNIGHVWVKERFLENARPDRSFVPARVEDNPYLKQEEYAITLSNLDVVTRAQLLKGDWDIQLSGNFFKRPWFEIVSDRPKHVKCVRYWDLAASKEGDYTVGALLGELNGIYHIIDVQRIRETPGQVEALVRQTAELDGIATPVIMEQEPGSSGINTIDHYSRDVLKGFNFKGDRVTGDKTTRAGPLSSASEAGNVKLVKGVWNSAWLDEAMLFPEGEHDDQIDATSGALNQLTKSDSSRFKVIHVGKVRG